MVTPLCDFPPQNTVSVKQWLPYYKTLCHKFHCDFCRVGEEGRPTVPNSYQDKKRGSRKALCALPI